MRLFLFAFFLATGFTASAQVKDRNLLARFTADALAQTVLPADQWKPFPKNREEWHRHLPDSTRVRLVKEGEKVLATPFESLPATVMLEYVRTGDRDHYQALTFGKRSRLWKILLAESIEGNGRFVDAILNGIWSICEESYWGVPAHLGMQKAGSGLADVQEPTVDLFVAETAALLAWADYFAGEKLEKISPLIRPRIRYEVNRRALEPILHTTYGFMGNGRRDVRLSNWAPWVMSNCMAATLLLETDKGRRTEALQRYLSFVDLYINGLGDEGGCDEGPSYWSGAAGCVFDALNLLESATGGKMTIYGEPIIRNMASYIYKTHIAGPYFFNVADASPTLSPEALLIYRFGKASGDKTMMRFGSWCLRTSGPGWNENGFYRTRQLFDLMAMQDCAADAGQEANLADVWMDDVQLMTARTANGLYVASHGGHNAESHNHNDVGDFVVYADGHPIIIDAGSGTYTSKTFSKSRYTLWFNTSPYHNLPTVNGQQQRDGQQFAATNVKYTANTQRASLQMNLEKAYPESAGIKQWKRTVQLNRKAGIVITDQFELLSRPSELTQTFMTVCPVSLDKPGTISFLKPDGKAVYLAYDPSQWEVKQEEIALTAPEDQKFKHTWQGQTLRRVLLISKKTPQQGQFTYSIRK